MPDIDAAPYIEDIRQELDEIFAKKREAAKRIQQKMESNFKKTADALQKCTEEKKERAMKIEVTENELGMILDGLLAYSESIHNDLHALNAMKGTRFEFECIEEEIAETAENLKNVREFRAYLVDIYNGKEEEQ